MAWDERARAALVRGLLLRLLAFSVVFVTWLSCCHVASIQSLILGGYPCPPVPKYTTAVTILQYYNATKGGLMSPVCSIVVLGARHFFLPKSPLRLQSA